MARSRGWLRTSRLAMAAKQLVRRGGEWLAARRAATPGWRPRVLFEVYNSIGFAAQEPVIRALLERGGVEVHVAGAKAPGISAERFQQLARLGVRHHSVAQARHRRFDAIIVTHRLMVRHWRTIRYVFLHHGSSFGNHVENFAFWLLRNREVGFLLALHRTEVLRVQTMLGEQVRGRVRAVGQPKLDRLVAKAHSRRDVLMSMGLDPGRTTVLFLSHWQPTSLLRTCGEEVLRFFQGRRDLNVLVTGHPVLWEPDGSGSRIDWPARLAWVADEPHMRLLPDFDDVGALMAAADLAVSDHSSATFECAVLFRPLVVFRHPEHPFGDPELDSLLGQTATVFSDVSQFRSAFDRAQLEGKVDRLGRSKLVDYCFEHVGTSGIHAAMAVEEIARCGSLAETGGE